jgi:hypothetical protein
MFYNTIVHQKLDETQLITKITYTQVGNGKPVEEDVEAKMAQMVCSLNNREECLACGS